MRLALISVSLMMGLLLPQISFAQKEAWGQVNIVKGDVKIIKKDGKTDVAKMGSKVVQGDTITTGVDSRTKIIMSDKNVINVSPDSKITIEKYENDSASNSRNVELKVDFGKVRADVKNEYDGEKNKFNVKTPSAVAGVRGTDFLSGYDRKTKQAKFVTFQGTVAVGAPGPGGKILNAVFVQPGQTTSVGDGKSPEAPKAMPKEELNKANNESKADNTPPKSDGQTSNGNKKGDKKDEGSDDKKQAATDDKSSDTKKDDSKSDAKKDEPKSDKSADAKKDEPKKADGGGDTKVAASDSKAPAASADGGSASSSSGNSQASGSGANAGTGDGKAASGGTAKADSGTTSRAPASIPGGGLGGGSMISAGDLGPDLAKSITIVAAPPVAAATGTFKAVDTAKTATQTQTPSTFVTNATAPTKTKVSITIKPAQ